MLLLLCPFVQLKSGAGVPGGWATGEMSPGAQSPEFGLKTDVQEPDLYIPLMSFITYVILYGIKRGIVSDFHPEILAATSTFAVVMLILEAGAGKIGFYLPAARCLSLTSWRLAGTSSSHSCSPS